MRRAIRGMTSLIDHRCVVAQQMSFYALSDLRRSVPAATLANPKEQEGSQNSSSSHFVNPTPPHRYNGGFVTLSSLCSIFVDEFIVRTGSISQLRGISLKASQLDDDKKLLLFGIENY